jgi:Fe-S oxidoreductase
MLCHAGSFGYERALSDFAKSGRTGIISAVRNLSEKTIVAASGTSCRHQIKDGTKRIALHPAEILWNALIKTADTL